MKILVTGKGGREHALLAALAESPSRPQLFCWPGSDAIHELAEPVPVQDLEGLIGWMKQEGIGLCVAGEESLLVTGAGLAILCGDAGIPCWGPPKESAQLEASKEFAKHFLQRHGIPTAGFGVASTPEEAYAALGEFPVVLKFDGLAAGKGVAVCADRAEAEDFIQAVLVRRQFGPGRLLIEECLTGPELSIFCSIVDGAWQVLTPARDYKRIRDGDQGPNTGGMGAVAAPSLIGGELMGEIEQTIIRPTVEGLQKDELPYRGFLYFGLMLTPEGPKVIEYNCRFGDPECEAVMPLLGGDLAEYLALAAGGELRPALLTTRPGWSVCLILASAGYPETSRNGDQLSGLDAVQGVRVYHCGTRKSAEGHFETNGGRVLAVVAQAESREAARDKVYSEAEKISFPGCQRRSDIATLHFTQS